MSKRHQVLFITTSSLAANPRLVKEFEVLKTDYTCHVLCFKHHDWSLELSEAIKNRNPEVHFIEIDRKKEVFQTLFCKVLHKSAIVFNPFFPKSFKICAFASNDKAAQLWLHMKSLPKQIKASHIIAHNLGAFFAAVTYSEKKDVALQLDIEDYYPGEALYFNKTYEVQNRMHIMGYSFLKADAITYASKGIQLECEKHFKSQGHAKQVTLINAFNATDFREPKANVSEKIKCVWFSQNIGPNRGLEQVFESAKDHAALEFHIIGNPNTVYLDTIDLSSTIKFHGIMTQTELHEFLSQMDIGLALESKTADFNRDICLTNKFLAYAQAGLFILATDTFGQRDFLNQLNYNAGQRIDVNLSTVFSNLDHSVLNHQSKLMRWENAKSFSWEIEQLKLIKAMQ